MDEAEEAVFRCVVDARPIRSDPRCQIAFDIIYSYIEKCYDTHDIICIHI